MPTAPERIFVEGRIFRVGIGGEPVQALAVASGRVVAAGSESEMRTLATADTEIVGLGGGVVVPGFHDAHVHLAEGALALAGLDLRRCESAEAVVERVRARAAELPPGNWIRGWGWDHTRWTGGEWPDKAMLDRATPRHPVFLSRIDGHVAWLSSSALHAVGITDASPDPDGGEILREAEGGALTGILLERARDLALERLPQPTDAERRSAVEDGLARLRGAGVTSFQDVLAPWALEHYARLREAGQLTARVAAWLPLELDRAETEALRQRFPPSDPSIAVTTLKVFLDGTLGSRSAAMLEPYADDPGNRGEMRVDPGWLAEEVRRAHDDGWAVAMHAIGDLAVRHAIEALEGLPPRARTRPHRIEHVQVIDGSDLSRLATCGAVASIQPVHFADDHLWIESRLGPDRAARAYPWRSLLREGVPLAMGTDWPVAPLDPFRNLEAAKRGHSPFSSRSTSRAPTERGEKGEGMSGEALSLAEAWEAYTLGSARAAGREVELGALEPGYRADFVVLSADPRTDPLDAVEVIRTYVDGRRVH